MAVARYLTAVSGLSDVWSVKNVGTVSRQAGGGPANDGIRRRRAHHRCLRHRQDIGVWELAERLESAGVAYGAIDLDWLCWCAMCAMLADGIGADVGDLVIANDRPIGDIADEILQWLRWP